MSENPAQPASDALDPPYPDSTTPEAPTAATARPSDPARGVPAAAVTDPTTITTEQIRAAYDALGLNPERFEDTRSIHISPDGLEIVRFPFGPRTLIPGTDSLYAELLNIRTEGFHDYGDLVALSEGAEGLRERASRLLARANELDAAEVT